MPWQPPSDFKFQDFKSNAPQPKPGAPAQGQATEQPEQSTQAAQAPGSQPAGQDLDYYELLQVDRNSHVTIIRYAYRFLAAMYHPDNVETGNADKFRIISEAWRTLSDEGKRAAYDLTLGIKDQNRAEQAKTQGSAPQFGRESLPQNVKTMLTWDEIELRVAVLQVLLEARRTRPATGGADGKMLMDCLRIDNVSTVEFALWYLREKGFIETGERNFMITADGIDYLVQELSKTQILDGAKATEEKTNALMQAQKAGTDAG